jgi:hypothetical protein
MIKPRRMRWAGHIAQMGEVKVLDVIGGKAGKKVTIMTKI